jgi:Carboxypeptidase regulatory-like domain
MSGVPSRGRQCFCMLAFLAQAVMIPSIGSAQATLAGIVKDSSGAVLPGVTVETSSPALIEKSRTATTDGTGQYQIVDLRPGSYSITFSLSGFRRSTCL